MSPSATRAPQIDLSIKFERTLRMLARHPLMGEAAPQYRGDLRRFTVGQYVLYYEPIQSGVRLVRVLHGARKIEDLLP